MCDDILKSHFQSLREFVVVQIRRLKLLGNERTTLLSHGQELQIIQYCLAQHNKQTNGQFYADPKQCCRLLASINRNKARKLEELVGKHLKMKEEDKLQELESLGEVECVSDRVSGCKDSSKAEEQTKIEKEISENGEDNNVDTTSLAKDIHKDLHLEPDLIESVLNLFQENLQSGNHITVMDVYESFIKEVFKRDSKISLETISSGCKIFLPEVSEMSGLESQIYQLLNIKGDNNATANVTVAESVERRDLILNDAISASPKTPKPSKAYLPSPGESTPRERRGCQRGKYTPSSSFNPKTPSTNASGPIDPGTPFNTPSSSVFPSTPLNGGERAEVQKKFIENIFHCYLHLLVNARCELALAAIFNVPERELNHEAFTHVKHLATSSKLSMYQTLSTFLMRVRLGGQDYAPSSDQPLLAYVKGLGNLVDFVDTLQTVIEENPQPRSVFRRLLGITKSKLSSCRSGRFPRSVVEAVAESISTNFSKVLDTHLASLDKDLEQDTSNGGSLSGQKSLSMIRHYLDTAAISPSSVDHFLLYDVRFSQDTPTRFQSLLSKFRSPMPVEEEQAEQDETSELFEEVSVKKPNQVSHFKASEALYLDGCQEDELVCTQMGSPGMVIVPSKTIVHPGTASRAVFLQQNERNVHLMESATTGRTLKRSNGNQLKAKDGTNRQKKKDQPVDGKENLAAPELETSPQAKKTNIDGKCRGQQSVKVKANEGTKGKAKSCRRKLMVQVKGQSKITGFFKT